MRRLAVSTLLLSLSIGGLDACALQRAPIIEGTLDAAMLDAPGLDAPGLDAPGLDAPGLDAPGLDAPGLDGGMDAGRDVPPGFDGGEADTPLDIPIVPIDTPPDVPTDARCSTGPDSDRDGVRDVCDPCPDDALDDSDGDGRCDSMDVCPGQDDRIDADGDGTPDGCDDWPCGERPTVTSPVSADGITISSLALNGGGRTAVVAGGATVTAAVGYVIQDCVCPGCIDQIEIGLVPGTRAFCAYDGNPPACPASSMGTRTGNITAPAASGVYSVRFRQAQDFSCNTGGRTGWWLAGTRCGPHDRRDLCPLRVSAESVR